MSDKMINGNTEGIRKSILLELENLIEYQISKEEILDEHVANVLLDVTLKINKEIIIVIDSNNIIVAIGIGEHNRATFPNIDRLARNED